ncbi:MAG: prolyl oligopeptidase family serine peptidase [Sulfitobacter sp.]
MRYCLILIAMMIAPMALACGEDTDCVVGDRVYRISMPEGQTGAVGAVIWAHGYRGSAAGVMRNGSLRKMVHAQGLALIAAQGVNGSWDLPKGPRTFNSTGASEFEYFEAVIADVSSQFGVDPTRLVASGFSAGGMMVWNLACARPDAFAGFVPISGTYWLQPPVSCATPVASIVHLHGNRDTTVPLDGRVIGETRQGKVSDALAMYAAHGQFGDVKETTTEVLHCSDQTNPDNAILEFCLFEGGHSFRTEYLAYGLGRLKKVGGL